jgi:hypothetical protein
MAVERVAGQQAFRVELGQGQTASAADVDNLIRQARTLFPSGSLSGFEFRLKAGANGTSFLELRKQNGWGAFKEALKIGRETRAAERRNALTALPAAYRKEALADQSINRDEARSLVSRVAIEADSARIAANPVESLMAAFSAGEKFDRFEFLECLAQVADSFGFLHNDGSEKSRPERIGNATTATVAPQIARLSDDQLKAAYRTYVANMPIMAGGSLNGTAFEFAKMIVGEGESPIAHPLLDSQNLSDTDREAAAIRFAYLMGDLAMVSAGVHEPLLSEMTTRGLLSQPVRGQELFVFEGREINHELLSGKESPFLYSVAARAYEKGNMLEAIRDMRAESLTVRKPDSATTGRTS